MENHSLATGQRDALARSVIAQRDELVKYPDGQVVFNFDSAALLAFYPVSVLSEGVSHNHKFVATQHYRVLCPEFEKHLNDKQPTEVFNGNL